MSWAAVVGRLPATILVLMASLACLALAALIASTIVSVYYTHGSFYVAGYQFGYAQGADDLARLKASINEQFEKLARGIANDGKPPLGNFSTRSGSGAVSDVGVGRCPDGEMIVGIQPMQSSEGTSLKYQCGRVPELKVQ